MLNRLFKLVWWIAIANIRIRYDYILVYFFFFRLLDYDFGSPAGRASDIGNSKQGGGGASDFFLKLQLVAVSLKKNIWDHYNLVQ